MNRKEFLMKGGLIAVSLSTISTFTKGQSKEPIKDDDCQTTKDILGPFYRKDAPIRNDLTFKGLEGNRITIKGKVFSDDCTTPIKSARVEIWHCDTEGAYDNSSDDFKHRAQWLTDEEGNYSFHTILPGKYLNGDKFRPSHIHFRVSANDHKDLVSQTYFQGDPEIEEDPWASNKNAEKRILPFILEGTNGGLTINFDIFLAKN